jgi:hypothetical protein
LRQLIYTSQATQLMDDDRLRTLLEECVKLNKLHEITGVLFYVNNRFIQCIEGKDEKIGQLASNIKNDERNEYFVVLMDKTVESRSFPGWSMGFKTYSSEEFKKQPGYFNLSDSNAVDEMMNNNQFVLDIMTTFYNSL